MEWKRNIRCRGDNTLEIADSVFLPRPVELSFTFNLHPGVEAAPTGGGFALKHEGVVLHFACVGKCQAQMTLLPGRVFLHFAHTENRRIVVTLAGRRGENTILFRMAKESAGRK